MRIRVRLSLLANMLEYADNGSKSTVAEALCLALRHCGVKPLRLLEADDFHPPENIEKMENGVALCDEGTVLPLGWRQQTLLTSSQTGEGGWRACTRLWQQQRHKERPRWSPAPH